MGINAEYMGSTQLLSDPVGREETQTKQL